MKQIEEGLWHWSAVHPNHGNRVSSHAYAPAGALIDPLAPEDGDGGLNGLGFEPTLIILSCRHHRRSSGELRDRFDAEILVPEDGMSEFRGDEGVRSYDDGELVANGILAIDIDALSPDETALHIEVGPGALLIADGIMRDDFDGPLGFVSDQLLGDEPDQVKQDIRAQFATVLESRPPFEHLLFAHGAPMLGDGRKALEEFVSDVR
jgi:hypothetical protein